MTTDFGGVKKDVSILIERSNGTQHQALVTTIEQPNTVNCEWFEQDDIKGKGVSLNMVFKLNPHLMPKNFKPQNLKSEADNMSRKSVMITSGSRLKKENKIPLAVRRAEPSSRSESRLPTAKSTSLSKNRRTELITKKEPTVRNIDKIESERIERRENQAKMRYQRDQIKAKHDINDAQWEFAEMIEDWRDENPSRPPHHKRMEHKINVCVRKRPLNKKETKNKETDVVTRSGDLLYVHQPMTKVDLTKYLENMPFRFDYVFDLEDDNRKVYEYTAKPLVESIFRGSRATCFAYGQTGSGKTHTMGGEFSGKNQNCSNGIYAFAAEDVFKKLRQPMYQHLKLTVSFFEIYANKVFDLLNGSQRLRILEDKQGKIRVVGLVDQVVETVDDVINVLREGSRCRTSGQTSANSNSSRSHAVFQLSLLTPGRKAHEERTHGMFSLIDLAGNERGADTMSSDRITRQEGADINKSLLALKECIRAMGKDALHVPFRGSTLTKVLRDSFIGEDSKTCMIATLSPGFSSCENTINTLRYADRVKGLSVNEKRDLEDLMEEITLEENTEEDSCLDMLATQNADQFTPQMLAITKAQDEQQTAEDNAMTAINESTPAFLDALSKWQEYWESVASDKNADVQEILRECETDFDNLEAAIKNMRKLAKVAFEKAENVDAVLAGNNEPKPAQKSSKPRGGINRRLK
ncbi:Oidioi.mRNA.OKI2018_I69.chr1.g2881.t1.cds [Oikopleura dioica]|uniref:Kinesin-like protein n=1 Tax=Oikopleura dioica TaxID=34765 RepID=A0ABN7SSE9_OIKDI|nr:Oidioi.mRNA.OKI2018_I69.chr1.g2881.t1.cds [Oikopleura dioica]